MEKRCLKQPCFRPRSPHHHKARSVSAPPHHCGNAPERPEIRNRRPVLFSICFYPSLYLYLYLLSLISYLNLSYLNLSASISVTNARQKSRRAVKHMALHRHFIGYYGGTEQHSLFGSLSLFSPARLQAWYEFM